ncbi:hypothetical protein [Mesorhizobium xinjiangense]|uniref:hypothetical protein n=1 Tax=Mesorhizobium xinjiangense TaxID=2678685 RepID=UPI0012EE8BDF|nr:hypothetical protein [Mesorhizobium xinjiangense]
MDRIRQVAIICVGRAVFFGTLAIGCAMIGFAYDPVAVFRSGAHMMLLMAAVLLWKAIFAPSQNPRNTEVWLHLDEKSRPSGPQSAKVFGTILREIYGRYALGTLYVACGLFLISLIVATATADIPGARFDGL